MTDGCNDSGAAPKKVSLTEAARTLQSGIQGADPARVQQLSGLQALRQAKSTSLTREHARVSQARGPQHPQTAALAQKLALNQALTLHLERAAAASRARVPDVDADSWIVHGHVRTRALQPVPQVTVALYTRDGHWLREFGHDCTDAEGHFKLCVKPRVKAPEVKTPEVAATAGLAKSASVGDMDTRASDRQVFLRVTDGEQRLVGIDKRPLTPRLGQVDYREIILGEAACTPPPSGEVNPGPAPGRERPPAEKQGRFLGNSNNRELHDLKNAKDACQLDEIAADRRVFFKSAEDAVKAGYDYCAHCFGKSKSKR